MVYTKTIIHLSVGESALRLGKYPPLSTSTSVNNNIVNIIIISAGIIKPQMHMAEGGGVCHPQNVFLKVFEDCLRGWKFH